MKLKQIIVSIILFFIVSFYLLCGILKAQQMNLQADSALTAESEVSSMGE